VLFFVWVWTVISHLQGLITGSFFTAAAEVWNRVQPDKAIPRKWYVVIFVAGYFPLAAFDSWQDQYRGRMHDTQLATELAALQREYSKRMNEWWTDCERRDMWQGLYDRTEAVRRKIYDKLAARSAVEAEFFNTARADERLPEALTLESSQCTTLPGVAVMSVYWHRLDRLGEIILRLRGPH